MTLLAQARVPGLALRTRAGRWIEAPVIPGTFLVNSGELLRRWTNDRFVATPHRVVNRSGRERHSIPFFFDTTLDYRMACLPTCHDAANPPRHDPISYAEYQRWFQAQNYDHIRGATAPADAVRVQAD